MIHFAHILHDAVNVLNKFSLSMQRSTCTIGDIHQSLIGTVNSLTKYSTKPGPKLASFKLCEEFKGHKLNGDDTGMNEIQSKVMTSLKKCLQGRFDDMNDGILHAARIANLRMWPSKSTMVLMR